MLTSVIIPTFQRADCIGEAIASAARQPVEDLEIVVIDDGSTDGTADIVERWIGGDRRIRLLRQSNQGVVAARNRGLESARGSLIAFLDSDDTWDRGKLQAQLAVMRNHPEVGLVWTDMRAVDVSGRIVGERWLRQMYTAYRKLDAYPVFSHEQSAASLGITAGGLPGDVMIRMGRILGPMIMGNLVHLSTAVIRREWIERIDGFDPSMRHVGEDYDLFLRASALGPVALIDHPMASYRIGHADQLTVNAKARYFSQNYLKAIERAMERYPIDLPRSLVDEAFAWAHLWHGEYLLDAGESRRGRHHLLKSLRRRPMQPRTLGLFIAASLPSGLRPVMRTIYRMTSQ
ncbi:MAG: glycosyltransferase [Geminicoccaceae bacterium]|nr:glycosyltransferase [Geminicoccaceae bacterium]